MSSGIFVNWFVPKFNSTILVHVPISRGETEKYLNTRHFKASFTRTVKVAVSVSGIFNLFNVMYKQHQRTALNPFVNGTKTSDIDRTCKRTFIQPSKHTSK